MLILGGVFYILGLLSLVFNREHILALLLSLEMMMLGVFILVMSFVMATMGFETLIFYLVVVVCEASLGLGLLVMMVVFFGSSSLSSISLLSC